MMSSIFNESLSDQKPIRFNTLNGQIELMFELTSVKMLTLSISKFSSANYIELPNQFISRIML